MLELRRRYSDSAGGGQPSRLPAGYKEVEWIGSEVAGAYIDLNLELNVSSAVDIDFVITAASVSDVHTDVFGYSGSQGNFLARYEPRDYGNIFRGKGVIGTIYKFELGKRYNIQINTLYDSEAIVNGDNIGTINNWGQVYKYPAFLMASYGIADGKPYASGCQKIYSAKFYESGVIMRDLIPCYRKSDNAAGMYDLVSGEFYTNAGIGTFEVGLDIIG